MGIKNESFPVFPLKKNPPKYTFVRQKKMEPHLKTQHFSANKS